MTPATPLTPKPSTPRIVGHRGAPRAHRENTIESFRAAAALGATMVELDVRRTLDNVMVVHHDPIVKEFGPICSLTSGTLPGYIPTLAAALDAARESRLQVNIEIKNDRKEPDFDPACRLADDVVALLRERSDGPQMLISSFHLPTLERIRVLEPVLGAAFLFSLPVPNVRSIVRRASELGLVALHPWWRSCSQTLVDLAHEAGLAVNTWTVNDPARMRVLAERGVDAIVTDVPDVARELFANLSTSEQKVPGGK
jgi:glycerophosphoryl diester phosphodiesterase